MTSEHTPLKELAAELGMDRSHLRKYVLSLGIDPLRVRTADSRNQVALAVLPEEADLIRDARAKAGFSNARADAIPVGNEGAFYIVSLDPELRPNRVKVGFSSSLNSRLATYRTSNPGSVLLRSWPCHRNWEPAAIACVASLDDCELVAGEVYDCARMGEMFKRYDALFALLGSIR